MAQEKDNGIVIEFQDVHKSFGEKEVHQGLSLQVRRGETLSLIGGSGEGKSVFLKQVMGLFKPESGRIFIDGIDIVPLPERKLFAFRKRIGYLFQAGALFDSLTVFENVAYPLRERFRQMKEPEVKKIVMEKIEMVGLTPDVAALMPVELSGGMRKRVSLARACATDPEIILWDEPTTELDPTNVKRIVALIKSLKKSRDGTPITSIAVTHDMESIFQFSDRIAMLYDKKIIAVDTVENMKSSPDQRVHDFIFGRMKTLE
ncbi:MAG TPA: ABC transporter ATP-binding protein [bacterium]|nr:ABC transporter ATP-binding protein [bacterium]